MKKYKVWYTFAGQGYALVEAENEQDAEDKFFDGDNLGEKEWGEQYDFESVEEVDDEEFERASKEI